jgi:hypothetical protein
MEAVIEDVAGHAVDQADVRLAGEISLAQNDSAQVVLAHHGDATAVAGAHLGRDRTLARS